jgi:hypothetical protein
MHAPPPDRAAAAVSRRSFLACCSGLLVAASGCASWSARTRTAYAVIADPAPDQYGVVLERLVEAILPGPAAGFPLTASQVHARLLVLFPLERDPRWIAVQKALVLFDQTDLFAAPLALVYQEELARDVTAGGTGSSAALARSHARDVALYAGFAGTHGRQPFTALALDRRRDYLDLWRASGYLIRRQFHASARSLVLIAAYSTDAVWPTLNYAGPVLGKTKA